MDQGAASAAPFCFAGAVGFAALVSDRWEASYLWRPGGAGESASLLGYPVTEIEDMPDIAANAFAIAFGDFRRGCLIVDRQGARVLHDPYSLNPYALFCATKRAGRAVQDFGTIKVMKFAAT